MPEGVLDTDALLTLPTLFLEEDFQDRDPVAKVGKIASIRSSGRELSLKYDFDDEILPFRNSRLKEFAADLDVMAGEFQRTHWAIKDADLFQVLLQNLEPRRQKPRVFDIPDIEDIEPTLVSVMMPIHPDFDRIYTTISQAAEAAGLHCRRADDIWENPAIIQDVVSLIDRSKIVVCDCSGRNPNVFYEIGIAHTLGREVTLITQSDEDIPFDLRHLRYVRYLNNAEGLSELSTRLQQHFADLV